MHASPGSCNCIRVNERGGRAREIGRERERDRGGEGQREREK